VSGPVPLPTINGLPIITVRDDDRDPEHWEDGNAARWSPRLGWHRPADTVGIVGR